MSSIAYSFFFSWPLLYVYVIVGFAVLLIVWFIFIYQQLARREAIKRSFGLQLFLITLPPAEAGERETLELVREKIAIMEKIYAALTIIKDSWWHNLWYGRPPIALELVIPHVGEEICFYTAIPGRFAPSLEKIIQGIFPQAAVEPVKDYNIFHPEGVAVGASARPTKSNLLPLKTYRLLEADPMKEITNVFSKLSREGEGAALQIVMRPAKKKWNQKIAKLIQHASKQSSFIKGVLGESVFDFLKSGLLTAVSPQKEKEEKLQQPRKPLTPKEEEVLRQLEAKAGKPLFETNVRLLASAATEERAEEIIKSLEAAFAQFNDQTLNGLSFQEQRGRAFRRFAYNFSFRLFEPSQRLVLSTEELTSMYHLPNVITETPKLKSVKSREGMPPADVPREGLLLGYNIFRSQTTEIHLPKEDRRRHLYVIGQTGTGKTAFLKELIHQDIEAGEGLCFIDPHGDAIEDILGLVPPQRLQDVVYFNPGEIDRPIALNFLEYDPAHPEQKTFIVNELFDIFRKIWKDIPEAFGPMFEQYFRNATLLVMEDPASGNTLYEIERVMIDKAFRDYKISKSANVIVNTFWREVAEKAGGEASLQNMVPYIASKFDVFLANEFMRPIILQEKSALNFRQVMDEQKILLVNLSKGRLGELNSYLLGLIVVGKILMAALSRGVDVPEEQRKDFYFYIDEFQNVTTKSIATILSEARKYRLDLTISHQFIGQLEDEIKKAVFGNVGSMAVFRIGSDDGEFLEKQFTPTFAAADLINLDNYLCYAKLLLRGKTSLPFSLHTYPPKRGDLTLASQVKQFSMTAYGRPRSDVEQEISQRLQRKL